MAEVKTRVQGEKDTFLESGGRSHSRTAENTEGGHAGGTGDKNDGNPAVESTEANDPSPEKQQARGVVFDTTIKNKTGFMCHAAERVALLFGLRGDKKCDEGGYTNGGASLKVEGIPAVRPLVRRRIGWCLNQS